MLNGIKTLNEWLGTAIELLKSLVVVGIIVGISIALTPIGMWRISKMDLVDKVKDLSQ